jgi:uncharacterized protein (TIGR03086 family)
MPDIRELDRRALQITSSIVDRVSVGQLDLPTPCAAWTLGQLLAHMVGQHYGFAAAAGGETTDLSVWADRPVGDDPAGAFAAAAATVTDAFAAEGLLERELWLPEVREGQAFTAPQAISFHFVDYVVHGWDVAATLGVRADFDDDILDAALVIAEQVPDGENRRQVGAAFAPGLGPVAASSTLDRMLVLLGRSPAWPN